MSYRIRIPKRVQRELDALPDTVYARIRERIRDLGDDPRPAGVKKLQSTARSYRVRAGTYRIVYEVDDAAQEIVLITVADRKDVYR